MVIPIAEKQTEQEQVSTTLIPAPAASETSSIIEQAREERIRIEAALKESKEVLARNEQAVAKLILGGRAEAGQAQPIEDEKEKIKREVREYFKGTGLDPFKK